MLRVFRLSLLVLMLIGCSAPAVTPVPTLRMVIGVATWTQEAPKKATSTDEPTFTPIPDTPTAAPTRIVDRAQLIKDLTAAVRQAKLGNITILDARYAAGAQGSRTVFQMEARYTAEPFDEMTSPNLVGVLAAYLASKPALAPGLTDFSIVVRDSQSTPTQKVEGKWQDLVDFSADRLTAEQLVSRLSLTVQVTPTIAPSLTRVATRVRTSGPTRTPRPTTIPTVFLPTETPVIVIAPPTNTNTPEAIVVPPTNPPARTCCKVCTNSKACGNSCISNSKTCHQPPGCACQG